MQLIKRDKNHQNSNSSPKTAFKIASEIISMIISMAFLKKAFLSTALLCLFFLAVPDRIKAQIASIISEDGDGIVGITSLMNATINGDVNAVKFFAKSGAEVVNQKNIGGASALHIAARIGNVEISEILIENGANVNIVDNEGWTPLMRAVIAKNIDLVKLLMNHGADPRKMNSVGETVIVNSASAACSECLEQILSNYNFIDNLNIDVLRKQLKDAIAIANNKNDLETQSIIKEYSNSELSKSLIYSLSKNLPNEAPITPKTDNGDGIVIVKSLNNMPENSNSIYRFAPVKKNAPSPNIYSSKIPQKTFHIIGKSSNADNKANMGMVNQRFIFKGGKKSYTPANNDNMREISDLETGMKKPYKGAYLLKTATDTDSANISNSTTNKKFIFSGDKKPYVPIKKDPLNSKKKTDIYNFKDDSANTSKIAESANPAHNNPSSDKEFIFKGNSKPNPYINSDHIPKTAKVSNVPIATEDKVISNKDKTDEKFIFKGNSKPNPYINSHHTSETIEDSITPTNPAFTTDPTIEKSSLKDKTDKKFIFKGNSKPSPGISSVNISKTAKTEGIAGNRKVEDGEGLAVENNIDNSNLDTDKRFIFKGKK